MGRFCFGAPEKYPAKGYFSDGLLGAYPGKKALVYFSGGAERLGPDYIAEYKRLFDSAVQSDISIMLHHARGLVALPPGGDASTPSSGGNGILYGTTQQGMRNAYYDSQESLYTLASETGGRTFLNSNDLITGISQAEEDISVYYELGYYSTNTSTDDKHHRVHVRLSQADEGYLSYRKGYYATGRAVRGGLTADNNTAADRIARQVIKTSDLLDVIEVGYLRITPRWYSACVSFVRPDIPFNVELSGEVHNARGQSIDAFRNLAACPVYGRGRSGRKTFAQRAM